MQNDIFIRALYYIQWQEYGDLRVSLDCDHFAEGIMVYTYPGITQYVELLSTEGLQRIREHGKDNELFQNAHRIIE